MTVCKIPPEIEHSGYYLSQVSDGRKSSSYCLVVAIRDKPTEAHYDPESLQLSLLMDDGIVYEMKLTRHQVLTQERKVCPGFVHLMDRLGKQVTFYSFGGTLSCRQEEGTSIFVLQSSAPILEMEEDQTSFQNLLAAESEALLAKIHAAWGRNDAGYRLRLVHTEPRRLFQAILGAIYRLETDNPILFEECPTFGQTLHKWAKKWSATNVGENELKTLLAPDNAAAAHPGD